MEIKNSIPSKSLDTWREKCRYLKYVQILISFILFAEDCLKSFTHEVCLPLKGKHPIYPNYSVTTFITVSQTQGLVWQHLANTAIDKSTSNVG